MSCSTYTAVHTLQYAPASWTNASRRLPVCPPRLTGAIEVSGARRGSGMAEKRVFDAELRPWPSTRQLAAGACSVLLVLLVSVHLDIWREG